MLNSSFFSDNAKPLTNEGVKTRLWISSVEYEPTNLKYLISEVAEMIVGLMMMMEGGVNNTGLKMAGVFLSSCFSIKALVVQ